MVVKQMHGGSYNLYQIPNTMKCNMLIWYAEKIYEVYIS